MYKYLLIVLFFCYFTLNYSFSQTYLKLNSGIGISQTTQFGVNISSESKSINALNSSYQMIYGYKLKKKPFSFEGGLGFTTNKVRFKFVRNNIGDIGYTDVEKNSLFEIPILVKWQLNSLRKERKKGKGLLTPSFFAKFGIVNTFYPKVLSKNLLKDSFTYNYQNSIYTVEYTDTLSRLGPRDYALLFHLGMEYNKSINKYFKVSVELNCNIGFKPVSAAIIRIKETIDTQDPIYSAISITSTSNYQLLRLGLQYQF